MIRDLDNCQVADVEDIGGRVAGFGGGRLECAEYALGVLFCTS